MMRWYSPASHQSVHNGCGNRASIMYPPPAAAGCPPAPMLWNWRRVRGWEQLTEGATSRRSASMAAADIVGFSAAGKQMFRWTRLMGVHLRIWNIREEICHHSQTRSRAGLSGLTLERKQERAAKAGVVMVRSGAQASQRKQGGQRFEARRGSDSGKSPEPVWSPRPAGVLKVTFLKVRGHLTTVSCQSELWGDLTP